MAHDLLLVMAPLALILGLILHGVAMAKNGDLAEIETSAGEVIIRPRGVLKILSFRWSVRLPVESIAGASVIDIENTTPAGMRYGATLFPGLVAGTFMSPEGPTWWLVGRMRPALEIDLRDGPLNQVVVQVKDPRAAAAQIRALIRDH
ncbi:hypothetical protein [Nonomuraea insulae]|uniref:Bacterial Pleckstrin homology domain-containing protein n=1 Tax=Nonomuraea insulae TaxID=1616787 RepID=A0ABW1CFH7_9ACTN